MSLFDSLKPKWKHADPQVRAGAVAQLKDQELLATIAESDGDETVRAAAIGAMTDRNTVARFATSDESSLVREGAVNRMDDDTLLQRISAVDTDVWVRTRAKTQSTSPFGMLALIRHDLSKLPVTAAENESDCFFKGPLDAMGKALMEDRRFCINGNVDEHEETPLPAGDSASPTPTPRPLGNSLRLLAVRRNEKGEPEDNSVRPALVEITVRRAGTDLFCASLRERTLVASPEALSRGSRSGLTTPPS